MVASFIILRQVSRLFRLAIRLAVPNVSRNLNVERQALRSRMLTCLISRSSFFTNILAVSSELNLPAS